MKTVSLVAFAMVIAMTFPAPLALAQVHDHSAPSLQTAPLEHVHLVLPKGLLSGFPVVDQQVSMQEAIDLGLKNNVQIGVAQAETTIQRSILQRAQAKRWPILSVGALTFIRAGNSQTLMTPDMMMNTVDATVFQDLNATAKLPLFTGGAITAGIRATRSLLNGAEAEARLAAVEMAFQVREAYLKAQLSMAEHLIHQEHIVVQQALLQNAESRFKVGRGLKADVLRIQTELAAAQRLLNEEHAGLNNQLLDLKAAMGVDLGSNVSLSAPLKVQAWSGDQLPELIQLATARHPAVLKSEAAVREAEAQVRVAKAALLPQVYGQVTGNLRFPTEAPMMANGVIGMLNASMPVFDKNRLSEISEANARLQKAKQELRAQQLEIGKQVAQAWNDLNFAEQNIKLSEAAIVQSQEDFRLIQKRAEVGRSIQVEVQDAALKWREAGLNQATAYYSYEWAKAKLLKATGEV
ncbi:TolC family protein [Vampirovibrio sp.]|uniref:TolC family protein n=1 Tax=Vampirovibrio sp. TaxID=2717857 RepID=UPI003593B763